jgi:glycosyltransferase involved in cell wall biosynthesis
MNEEDRIADCIASVSRFADEIVLLDGGSTDATPEIAERLGARVLRVDWPGFVAQKNRALAQCAGEWILCIDADERPSPGLGAELRNLVESQSEFSAYRLRRINYWQGRAIQHGLWGRDRPLRFVRRGIGRWTGTEPHDLLEVSEGVGELAGALEHHPYRTLAEHLRTIDRYSSIAAENLDNSGCSSRWWDLALRPPAHLLSALVLHGGWRDGVRGICLAWLGAAYVALKWGKLRLRQERQ